MLPRLLLCLSLAACAARPVTMKAPATTTSPRYELCRDPDFHCVPATRPVKVDTNLERHEEPLLVANRFRA